MDRIIIPIMGAKLDLSCASDNRKLSLYKNLIGYTVEFHYFGSNSAECYEQDGVKFIHHKYLGTSKYLRYNFFKRLIKYLYTQEKYKDKIFMEYPWGMLYFAPFLMVFKPKNIRIFAQDSEHPFVNIKFFTPKGIAKYLSHFLFRLFVVRNLYFAIIMTNNLCKIYRRYGVKNIVHIPMTVDFSRFDISKGRDCKRYFAYCGTLNCNKDGVDILIEAFIKLASEYEDIDLYLIGPKSKNPRDSIIVKKIQESKYSNRVHMLGKKKGEEIPKLIKNAYALCLARPDSKQAQYGFPTKLGEYLATGNPVIVTDVGEISLYLKDGVNSYIAKNNSVDSYYDKMKESMNYKQSFKIGKNGKETAYSEFSSLKNSQKLNSYIKTLM